MKTLLPLHITFTFWLLILQTYLLAYITMLALRAMKLLKQPYNGMDYAESLPLAIVMLGTLLISSADINGIFQAAKFYNYKQGVLEKTFFLFFARSFGVVLFFNLLFVAVNFLNIRLLFRGHYKAPAMPVSLLLCALSMGIALVCWLTCREIIDNITPRLIIFQ